MLIIPINSIDVSKDDTKWLQLFEKTWPAYKKWFSQEGLMQRPGYLTSLTAFEKTFPELIDTYKRLNELTGNKDVISRYLSMYSPPPYMSGCSQVAWTRTTPFLIRNYDYSPRYFEGVLMKTNWLKPVIGMSDCSWGLLDGINGDGLAVSLTFGGRRMTAPGFGIPLVLRYCLETCSNTTQAVAKLRNIPVHMAYNVTILDAQGAYATIYFVPGQKNQVTYQPVGTNHQEEITWPDYAVMTQTVERRNILEFALMNPYETKDSLIQRFLKPPLFNSAYEKAFGTLFTAIYHPEDRTVQLLWPGKSLHQEVDQFVEQRITVQLRTNVNRKLTI